PIRRLRLLAAALETFPDLRLRVALTLRSVLAQGSALGLLAKLGLPTDRGFFAEAVDRLSRRFLPEPVDERDVSQLLARLFPSRKDSRWLGALPPELAGQLASLLDAPQGT